jgi:hypothetical protein
MQNKPFRIAVSPTLHAGPIPRQRLAVSVLRKALGLGIMRLRETLVSGTTSWRKTLVSRISRLSQGSRKKILFRIPTW